jgi:hypothetical protein
VGAVAVAVVRVEHLADQLRMVEVQGSKVVAELMGQLIPVVVGVRLEKVVHMVELVDRV